MKHFFKHLSLAVSLLLPLPALAQTFSVQPEILNPAAVDGPGAFRAFLGEASNIRCTVRNTQTGAVLTDAHIADQLRNRQLRIQQVRGGPGQLTPTGPGTATFTANDQGLRIFQCAAQAAPSSWQFERAFLAIDVRQLDPKGVVAFATGLNDTDPVQRVSIGEPFLVRVKAFSEGRTETIPVSISNVVWTRNDDPCQTNPNNTAPFERIFDRSVLTSAPPTAWSAPDGATVRAEIFQPGDYFACLRVSGGQGGNLIEKSIEIEAKADATPPLIEDLVITQDGGLGRIDLTPPGHSGVLTEYEVRAVVRDDDPAGVRVTFSNQHTQVTARLSQAIDDRGVFVARMPVTDGLQIVTAIAKDGGLTSQKSVFSVAAQEFLTPFNQSALDRKRHGQELFVTLDVLEDKRTHAFAPMSLEAALNDLPRDVRRGFFPQMTIRQELFTVGELPVVGGSPFFVDAIVNVAANDLSVSMERGTQLSVGIEVDVSANVRFACARIVFDVRRSIPCPVTISGGVDVKGSYSGPVDFVRDFSTGEMNFALDWERWEDEVRAEATVDGLGLLDGVAEGVIEDAVRDLLTKKAVAGELTKNDGLRRFKFFGREWIGAALSENRSVRVPFELPKLFEDGVIPGAIASTAFRAELGGNFASVRMGGAFVPDSLQFPKFTPRYVRVSDDRSLPTWRTRDSLLRDTSPQERFPPDDVALMMHLDTFNGHLAGMFASGVADFDLSGPEFVDLFVPDGLQSQAEIDAARNGSPFAALQHFPQGRVRLHFEHAPRLAPRADLSSHLALEVGPITLDIDLRAHNGARLVLQAGAILATEIGFAHVDPPRGLLLDFPQNRACTLGGSGRGLDACKNAVGFAVLERTGFTEYDLLPVVGAGSSQQQLVDQWNAMRKLLGMANLFTDATLSRRFQSQSLENFARLGLGLRKDPTDPQAEPFLPISIDIPPVVLSDRLEAALGVTLPDKARAGIVRARVNPDVDMLGADRGWIGIIGSMAPVPRPSQ